MKKYIMLAIIVLALGGILFADSRILEKPKGLTPGAVLQDGNGKFWRIQKRELIGKYEDGTMKYRLEVGIVDPGKN